MKTITVKVTKQDIEDGAPSDPKSCPIALALKRRFPSANVCVRVSYAYVDSVHFETSDNAQAFIHLFDSRRPVRPATFRFKRVK